MDEIRQPQHYNSHPSGLECKDITMCLSNGVANAVKYVWRKNDKHETPEADLRKAVKYLEFEIKELDDFNTRSKDRAICFDYQIGRASGLLNRVVSDESDRVSAQFYRLIDNAIWAQTNRARRSALERARELLEFYLNDEGASDADD